MKIFHDDNLERYKKIFEMLLEAIPSSVLLIDRDMHIVSANRNFLNKSKRSLSATIGRRLEEVFPPVILNHMDVTRRVRQVFDENEPTTGERMIYRAPGIPMRIYYYRILPFSWNGVVENAMFLMDDVTEQVRLSKEVHRVERHLASIVESANDIVLSTDMEGKILSWNNAAEKLSGYTPDEVNGHFFFEYFKRDHQGELKRIFSSIKKKKKPQMGEWDIITKNEDIIPASWVCSPMQDDRERIVGIVVIGRDLSERHKFETQLRQSQKLAALGVMAGGIAHEIRNPLAICSSASQFLIEDDIAPEFRKECAGKIHAGIRKASLIIENLLRFARPSARKDMIPVDILSILKETLSLIANQTRIQKIRIDSHFPQKSLIINSIENLLQQVFMNLFLNAFKAMPDGGTLSVSVEETSGEVLARVADTGHGIPEEDIDKIFDPFYTAFPEGKGTGLGLSVCYSIVKHYSGNIEVDSVAGKGSTFTVRLPLL